MCKHIMDNYLVNVLLAMFQFHYRLIIVDCISSGSDLPYWDLHYMTHNAITSINNFRIQFILYNYVA